MPIVCTPRFGALTVKIDKASFKNPPAELEKLVEQLKAEKEKSFALGDEKIQDNTDITFSQAWVAEIGKKDQKQEFCSIRASVLNRVQANGKGFEVSMTNTLSENKAPSLKEMYSGLGLLFNRAKMGVLKLFKFPTFPLNPVSDETFVKGIFDKAQQINAKNVEEVKANTAF